LPSLLPDGVLADPDCLVGGNPTIVGSLRRAAPFWDARVYLAFTRPVDVLAPGISPTAIPKEIEGVSFLATLRILDSNHGHASVSRIANQLLLAPPVHSGKAKIRRIRRHCSRALEPAPLRALPSGVPQRSHISPDLDLGGSIHHYFDRALTAIGIAATR
jgi:hypothetical protein